MANATVAPNLRWLAFVDDLVKRIIAKLDAEAGGRGERTLHTLWYGKDIDKEKIKKFKEDRAKGTADSEFRNKLMDDPKLARRILEGMGWAFPFEFVLPDELTEIDSLRRRQWVTGILDGEDGQARKNLHSRLAEACDGADETRAALQSLDNYNIDPMDTTKEALEQHKNTLVDFAVHKLPDVFPKIEPDERDPFKAADGAELLGLALSGGGIRSATFNLGILQALAQLRALPCVDYLSTVSGGGYIGSWLIAWLKRASFSEVERGLDPYWGQHHGKATPQIEFLRDYSNYLTPHVGFLTADTWAAIVTVARNLLLNLTVLVSATVAFLLFAHWLTATVPSLNGGGTFVASQALLSLAFLLFAFQFLQVATRKPLECFLSKTPGWIMGPICVLWITGAYLEAAWFEGGRYPLQVAAWSFRGMWVLGSLSEIVLGVTRHIPILKQFPWYTRTPAFAIGFWLMAGLVLWALPAGTDVRQFMTPKNTWQSLRDWLLRRLSKITTLNLSCWIGSRTGQIAVCILSLASYLCLSLPCSAWVLEKVASKWSPQILLMVPLGVPAAMLVYLLAAALQVGLTGVLLRSEAREWTARMGAWIMIFALVWATFFGVAIYSPLGVIYLLQRAKTVGLAAILVWLLHTASGIWSSYSARSGSSDKRNWLDLLAVTAPPAFALGLLILLSYGIYRSPLHEHFGPNGHPWWELPLYSAVFLLLALLLSLRVDVNEFSMNTFYRNRLVRCYLGASRSPDEKMDDPCRREPNPFSGFDPKDDLLLKSLKSDADPRECEIPYVGPYPIINAALNLTHGRRLAWQERKAESFTFTPLYCGGTVTTSPIAANQAYLPTNDYFYPPEGVYVGTAVAISGAAVSPLVGFHYSAGAGFLLAVFNARLGQWLANPNRPDIRSNRFGPRLGLWYLLKELFGLMDDLARYVYLSDGGHFENLGVYELVRRRCRYIIVGDASADPRGKLEDLGNAIRKCRADFGVEIDFDNDLSQIRPDPTSKLSQAHYAVGTITYPELDAAGNHFEGKLVYLKASLTKNDPADVLEYASAHTDFPHQSTADQWFDEAQFESYRKLGYHIAKTVFDAVPPDVVLRENRENFFKALEAIGHVSDSACG
jgi:predicted acylesterase/phospholipase RssA